VYHLDVKQARTVTEAEILNEVVGPGQRELTPEAAKSILSLKFSRAATTRIRSLLRENNRGTISPEARMELEKYLRVGQLLDLLHAKARLTTEARKAA
jgi:hypothetical protein